jgi:HEAT repeat protein
MRAGVHEMQLNNNFWRLAFAVNGSRNIQPKLNRQKNKMTNMNKTKARTVSTAAVWIGIAPTGCFVLACMTLLTLTTYAQQQAIQMDGSTNQSSFAPHPQAGQVKPNPEVEAIIAKLQRSDYQSKVNAALKLKEHGADAVAAIPALIDNLGNTEDGAPTGYYWSPAVYNPSTAAVEALKKIVPDSNGWGLDYAKKALANGNVDLRRGLAEILPSYGDKGIPLLLTILTTDDDSRTLDLTEKGLGGLGSAATPALKNLIDSNPKGDLRRHALLALIYGHDPQSLPILIAALDTNSDEWLKSELQNGISDLATENELGRLQLFLHDSNTFVGECAVGALKRIGSPKAIEILFGCINDVSVPELTRASAVTAISQLNDPRAVQTLLTSSESSEKWVRYNAIEAMRNKPDQAFVKRLVAALNDSAFEVRREALSSLMKQKVGKRELFDFALKMLADSNDEVTRNASKALQSLTGMDFGTDAGKWNDWLKAFGGDFDWDK